MVSLLLGWLGILYGWVPGQIFNYKCITCVCMICYDSLLGFNTLLNSSKSISSPWSSFIVFRTASLTSKVTWQFVDAICSNNNFLRLLTALRSHAEVTLKLFVSLTAYTYSQDTNLQNFSWIYFSNSSIWSCFPFIASFFPVDMELVNKTYLYFVSFTVSSWIKSNSVGVQNWDTLWQPWRHRATCKN